MPRAKPVVICKDCRLEGVTRVRPAPNPGPRCDTHWRRELARRKTVAHGRHVARNFELDPQDYDAIYKAQGGRCYICRIATGKTKMLAVDHDHKCTVGHDPKKGCRLCVRALLCSRCNRLIGFLNVPALWRAIRVLVQRPAQAVLNGAKIPAMPLEITATEPQACAWPECTVPIWEGCRIVYATSDSKPVHVHHYTGDPLP